MAVSWNKLRNATAVAFISFRTSSKAMDLACVYCRGRPTKLATHVLRSIEHALRKVEHVFMAHIQPKEEEVLGDRRPSG